MLVKNWWSVLRYAWSVRLILAAIVFTALEVALPLLNGFVDVPPGLFAAASGICSGLAFAARLVAQKRLSDDGKSD